MAIIRNTWCNNRHNGRKAFFKVDEFAKIDIEKAFRAFGESARGALKEVQTVIKAMDDPEKLELEQAIRVNDNNGFNSDAQPDNALRWIASWGVGFVLVSGALVTTVKMAAILGLTEPKEEPETEPKKASIFCILRNMLYDFPYACKYPLQRCAIYIKKFYQILNVVL